MCLDSHVLPSSDALARHSDERKPPTRCTDYNDGKGFALYTSPKGYRWTAGSDGVRHYEYMIDSWKVDFEKIEDDEFEGFIFVTVEDVIEAMGHVAI